MVETGGNRWMNPRSSRLYAMGMRRNSGGSRRKDQKRAETPETLDPQQRGPPPEPGPNADDPHRVGRRHPLTLSSIIRCSVRWNAAAICNPSPPLARSLHYHRRADRAGRRERDTPQFSLRPPLPAPFLQATALLFAAYTGHGVQRLLGGSGRLDLGCRDPRSGIRMALAGGQDSSIVLLGGKRDLSKALHFLRSFFLPGSNIAG